MFSFFEDAITKAFQDLGRMNNPHLSLCRRLSRRYMYVSMSLEEEGVRIVVFRNNQELLDHYKFLRAYIKSRKSTDGTL